MIDWTNRCHFGDCLETLRRMPDGLVQTCVTSPPYFGLRDYGHAGQIGLEPTPDEFVAKLVMVFREVRRVLRDDGTLWLNIGDGYAGYWGDKTATSTGTEPKANRRGYDINARPSFSDAFGGSSIKPKDLMGIPWLLAFALRADGWYLRQDIIWHKPNPMPESVRDRCTKAHEYVFLLSKSERYFFDSEAMQEKAIGGTPGNTKPTKGGRAYEDGAGEHRTAANLHNVGARETRNRRSVWTVATRPYKGAHFATFPTELIEPCILAGAPAGGIVLDPFFGSGTTGQVSQALGRQFIGLELNEAYKPLQDERLRQPSLLLEAA